MFGGDPNPETQPHDYHVQAARYSLLSEIVLLLAETEDLDKLLSRATNKVKWVIDFTRCTLALVNPDGQSFNLSTLLETNRKIPKVNLRAVPIDKGIPGEVMRIQRPFLMTDMAELREKFGPLPDTAMESPELTAILSLPLQAYGKMLGAIVFSTRNEKGFSDDDIKAATAFATHLALAIDHSQQKKLLEETNKNLEQQVAERTTDLATARDEAQEVSANLQAILNNLADGLLVINPEGVITRANPALSEMFNLGNLDLRGKNSKFFVYEDMIQLMDQIKQNPYDIHSGEVKLAHKRVGKVVATPVLRTGENTDNTQLLGSVLVIRDITHEKEIDQMKTEFLSTVSHELRTPLTSLLGFAKITRKRLDDVLFPVLEEEENRKVKRAINQVDGNIDIIISEGDRLTKLINDVLDIAKIESGKIEWHMEPVSIPEIIHQARTSTLMLFEDKNIPLIMDIEENLPDVEADHDRIIQVLINLLSNAVKFTDEGSVTVRVKRVASKLMVSVVDTGMGIPVSEQQIVFERFKQLGDTLTDKPKGTGLGLPICREIIEHHGGDIWLESVPDEGSTFSFTLPIPSDVEKSTQEIAISTLVQKLKEQQILKLHSVDRKTILIVDDEENIRHLLRQNLEEEGYLVREASDGLQAINAVKDDPPDLILLDVMMPQLNGFDVLSVLKGDPQTMGIPIIILSIVEDRERGYRLGVDRYLNKPIDNAVLFSEISQLLEQGISRRKVMVIDESESMATTIATVLQQQGYQVSSTSDLDNAVSHVMLQKPDMILAHLADANNLDLVQTLRIEKGLENVEILLYE